MAKMEGLDSDEWKRVLSIKEKFYSKRNKRYGVTRAYVENLIKLGELDLESIRIDRVTFYYISLEDQKKPDWGLSEKLVKRDGGENK